MNSPDGNVDLNHACNASVTEQEWHTCNSGVRVERPNVPLPYIEFLIPPFGPNGESQLMNYDIIEFPEEGNTKSSNQRDFPS